MPPVVHAASAIFPGVPTVEVLRRLATTEVTEPLWGPLSAAHVQLCPQNPGWLSEEACERHRATHPQMRLRLHANARVLPRHQVLDASTVTDTTWAYYEALADRSRRLGAPAYSLHAGYADQCSLHAMFDRVRRVQDAFGDIPVAVEGLYPSRKRAQLLSTWAEYRALLATELFWAIDLSHLQIVAKAEGHWDWDTALALVGSAHCLEVHVSDNDGRQDQHQWLSEPPVWMRLLAQTNPQAVVFSEGDQFSATRRRV